MEFGPPLTSPYISLPALSAQEQHYQVVGDQEYMAFGPRVQPGNMISREYSHYASVRGQVKPPPPPRSVSIKSLSSEGSAPSLGPRPASSSSSTSLASESSEGVYDTIGMCTRSMSHGLNSQALCMAPTPLCTAHSEAAIYQVPKKTTPPRPRHTVSRSGSCIRPTRSSKEVTYATIKRRHTLLGSKSDTDIKNVDYNCNQVKKDDIIAEKFRSRAFSESAKSKEVPVINFRSQGPQISLMGPPKVPPKNFDESEGASILRARSKSFFGRKRRSSDKLVRNKETKLRRNSSGNFAIPAYV